MNTLAGRWSSANIDETKYFNESYELIDAGSRNHLNNQLGDSYYSFKRLKLHPKTEKGSEWSHSEPFCRQSKTSFELRMRINRCFYC